ncbi:MAG: (2Fe-2S)-binding protein [Hydrogenophaga sp.]|uniref:(2Fe-2S)-binding protein n=1 Tax=Hydrogenophaga sp. TaxID=1904254 RepID=UPI00271C7DE2|nr:(2Fe-2S)-binding protein [Hydrogenophaga sp.]MDO9146149.1 (2Fe-2S)-binding protein [Hydrogenophaga sp.]MDO9605608.1 (2Fe-2S)-binding protein [Hydrogenophaga sp.]MDP2165822.1 (2Fe-2S)-binding protein [Hydrogenophaga sp.]MDP3476990.1 (2Fe-2S)-binding protein [Hydrogenophaga sp.]
MDRREFVESCALGAGSLAAAVTGSAWAANAKPRAYARVLLTDAFGQAIRASSLLAQTNYVFHYPFEATPVFLLDLGKPALATSLRTRDQQAYQWPGGVGPTRSLVAFSAICAHKLVYPTKDLSFISFRKGAAINPQTPSKGNDLIHCCADHSQYDPARGARVLGGPAEQPLCAVLLDHDPKADTLTATGTLGGELFDDFFKKYEMKLSLEAGPRAKQAVVGRSVVRELDSFCRNAVRC